MEIEVYTRPLRWGLLLSVVTKVTKNTLLSTAQEGIKMTALRGKSRISLPLRLQLSCAEPTLPSAAASVCKQERRVGINLRYKNI